jgi:hypothetical protein
MSSSMGLLRAIYDHLLQVMPEDPADAKRLDDIVDPDDDELDPPVGQPAFGAAEPGDPSSGVRATAAAAAKRLAG